MESIEEPDGSNIARKSLLVKLKTLTSYCFKIRISKLSLLIRVDVFGDVKGIQNND